MNTERKKKLMVIVGAGASVELGMPSLDKIDRLFSKWAKSSYSLAISNKKCKTLYCYIRDEINHYYNYNAKEHFRKTNFEEVLYVMLQLSAILGDDNYNFPMNAFCGFRKLPKIKQFRLGNKVVDGNDLKYLYYDLVDRLLKYFRERCSVCKKQHGKNFDAFDKFIKKLNRDFDVAFITLNYDNLITQVCPDLFTGFDKSTGVFNPSSVYERSDWGLIYHLHGSVHFDMPSDRSSNTFHVIKWNPDLESKFSSNALGRNAQRTSEGIDMPTSAIVVGYGKTSQIQRVPFRTYYSRIDQITSEADAFLFLGYGFNDFHLNNSLHSIRDGEPKKPVVVVDFAPDSQESMQTRNDNWSRNLCKTIHVGAGEMATKKYKFLPANIAELKLKGEFETSRNSEYPLSIWYGGFIQACKNYRKIKSELRG